MGPFRIIVVNLQCFSTNRNLNMLSANVWSQCAFLTWEIELVWVPNIRTYVWLCVCVCVCVCVCGVLVVIVVVVVCVVMCECTCICTYIPTYYVRTYVCT